MSPFHYHLGIVGLIVTEFAYKFELTNPAVPAIFPAGIFLLIGFRGVMRP